MSVFVQKFTGRVAKVREIPGSRAQALTIAVAAMDEPKDANGNFKVDFIEMSVLPTKTKSVEDKLNGAKTGDTVRVAARLRTARQPFNTKDGNKHYANELSLMLSGDVEIKKAKAAAPAQAQAQA